MNMMKRTTALVLRVVCMYLWLLDRLASSLNFASLDSLSRNGGLQDVVQRCHCSLHKSIPFFIPSPCSNFIKLYLLMFGVSRVGPLSSDASKWVNNAP